MADISDRLAAYYTGVLHDVMRGMGLRDFTLPPELRPLFPEKSISGPAFTIDGKVVPETDTHETLLAWTGLLSQAPFGTIWVSQPNDRLVAHMGELSAETLKSKCRRPHPRRQLHPGNRLPGLEPWLDAPRHRRILASRGHQHDDTNRRGRHLLWRLSGW
jgi:hypothetical protein